MRIVVDINHPAHVHFFKHFVWSMRAAGHEVLITASDKDMALHLLDRYGFEYVNLRSYGRHLVQKMIRLPIMDVRLWRAARRFRPDVLLGVASVRAAHAAALLRSRCIIFDDSEHARIEVRLYLPFVERVCTPSCFKRDLGPRHLRYDGFHELAYLHPSRFRADPAILGDAGLAPGEPFSVVRFVSWGAVHDVGQKGFRRDEKRRLVDTLAERGRVFVVSEGPLEAEFEPHRLTVPPERIHDLLFYAQLYVGEGATMATEACLLGTPSVYVSSLVGTMGNFEELGPRWDLVHAFRSASPAIADAAALAGDAEAKAAWGRKRERLLEEKVDVTQWMIDLVLGGPGAGERD